MTAEVVADITGLEGWAVLTKGDCGVSGLSGSGGLRDTDGYQGGDMKYVCAKQRSHTKEM